MLGKRCEFGGLKWQVCGDLREAWLLVATCDSTGGALAHSLACTGPQTTLVPCSLLVPGNFRPWLSGVAVKGASLVTHDGCLPRSPCFRALRLCLLSG